MMKSLRWFKMLTAALLAALMAGTAPFQAAAAEEEYDPINSLLFLNMAVVSVRKVVTTEDRIVLDQEYKNIINNNALGEVADDYEIKALYSDLLDTITECELRDEQKKRFQEKYDRRQEKALRSAIMAFSPYGGDLLSFALSVLSQGVSAYFGYQDSKTEMRQGLDESLWTLEKKKIEDFNELQKSLLNASWSILRKYNLPDKYRITQKNLELLDDAMNRYKESDAVEKFAALKDIFFAYPPFWFYYGEAAYKRGDKDLARRCFGEFDKAWRHVLRYDPFKVQVVKYQILLEERPTREKIRPLLKALKENSYPTEWQDNLFYGVVSYYFGDKEDGMKAVKNNLLFHTERDISQKIYDSMAQDKMDEATLPGELEKWGSENRSDRGGPAANSSRNYDRPRESRNYDRPQ